MIDLPVVLLADIQKTGKLGILFAPFSDCVRSGQKVTVTKCLLISLDTTERIGFMQEFSSQNL